MRSLLGAVIVLAVLVAGYLVADTAVRDKTQTTIAHRIESNVPGTVATVRISSFPFTGRLAVDGTVKTLTADVTGVSIGGVAVQSVDLAVHDVRLDRSQLVHGNVVLESVSSVSVTAIITQAALDSGTGLPVTLGSGTVGLAGMQVPATVSITSGNLRIGISGIRTITLPLLPAALLPCPASGSVESGQVLLSCSTSTVPSALVDAVASAS